MHRHSFLTSQRTTDKGHHLKLPEETEGECALFGKGNRLTWASSYISSGKAVLAVSGNVYQPSEGKSF